jgi:ribosomal protein S18 acetylase RimI-like enzyme
MDWTVFDGVEVEDLRLRFAGKSDFSFVLDTVCDPSTLMALNQTRESARAMLQQLWSEGLDAPDMRHFVAETTEEKPMPVGYLRLLYPFPVPRSLWLSFIATAPSCRRRGYGRRILRMLLSVAETSDCVEKFGMHTGATSTAARGLYDSLGFRLVKREPWQNEDGTQDERLTYCRTLRNG